MRRINYGKLEEESLEVRQNRDNLKQLLNDSNGVIRRLEREIELCNVRLVAAEERADKAVSDTAATLQNVMKWEHGVPPKFVEGKGLPTLLMDYRTKSASYLEQSRQIRKEMFENYRLIQLLYGKLTGINDTMFSEVIQSF